MNLSTYKAFCVDLDGCLRYGLQPAPGAVQLLQTLRRLGASILVLTNTSSRGAEELAQELQGMGLNLAPHEIQTTFDVAATYLRDRIGTTTVLCIGSPALQERLRREGHAVLPLARGSEARAVVVGRDLEFNIERMVAASRAIDHGAMFVALNVDVRMPVEGGEYTAGAGSLVAAISALACKQPEVLGKPSRTFFELALRRLGVGPQEAVMIGDSVDSDIKGAKAVGLFSILVIGSNVQPPTQTSQADLVVHDLTDLSKFFM